MLDKTILSVSYTTERRKTGACLQLFRPSLNPGVFDYYDITTKEWITDPAGTVGQQEGNARAVLDGTNARIELFISGAWIPFVGYTEIINGATGKKWDGNQYL